MQKSRKGDTHYFTVTGRGHFPLDMLRYDCCWPARQEDVEKLGNTREHRFVVLASTQEPTVGRWNSFGWLCSGRRTTQNE